MMMKKFAGLLLAGLMAISATSAQETAPQPSVPQPYRTEILSFDNWSVTCQDFNEGKRKRICSAQLQVANTANNQVLLSWTIVQEETPGKLRSFLAVPTGVNIPAGLDVHFGAAMRKVPFDTCEPNRCTALVTIDAALVKDVTSAQNADVIVQGSNGKSVKFSFPLKGFDKAYLALTK